MEEREDALIPPVPPDETAPTPGPSPMIRRGETQTEESLLDVLGEENEAAATESQKPLETPETVQEERVLTLPTVARGPWERGVLWAAVGTGLAAALIVCLVCLPVFSATVLPHIVSASDSSLFQEVPEGLPIPRLLDWNPALMEALTATAEMSPLMRLLWGAFFCGVLLRIAVAVLNPSFRLFRPPRSAPKSLLAAERMVLTLELHALAKAFRVLMIVGIPLTTLWLLTALVLESRWPAMDASGRPGAVWALRLALLGAALWIGFHRLGLTGNVARPRLQPMRGRWLRQGVIGALYGLGSFVLIRWLFPFALAPLLNQYQMLGTFHVGSFWEIARGFFGVVGGIGFALGTLLCVVGLPKLAVQKRLLLSGLVALGALLAWGAARPFTLPAMASRLDITPAVLRGVAMPYDPRAPGSGVPNMPAATEEFARRVGLKVLAERNTRDVLIFDKGIRVTRQRLATDDGLPTDAESVRKVRAFLEKRNYHSALAWVATRYLYNAACLDNDLTGAMKACLDDLARGPHARRTLQPLREMLFSCAASPQNRALLDRLASEREFVTPDRESKRMLGDLYRRFGAVEEALNWYRRADMPRSFLNRIRTERPMYHQGRVTGRLTLNGKPLAGVRVGALPFRMNGLPHDLEGSLLVAKEELAPSYYIPQFLRFDTFRAICASTVTDASGAFTMEHLVEGEYVLTCALPPSLRSNQLQDRPQEVKKLFFNYDYPQVDMGTISLTTVPRVASP